MNPTSNVKTYFSLLPTEIITVVLSYLKISDLLVFCDVFKEYNCLLNKLDLTGCWNVDIFTIPTKVKVDSISAVNLNKCHWLKKEELHAFILNFENLKALSALQTDLNLTDLDIEVYNRTKINKLAVTLNDEKITKVSILLKITALYLEVEEKAARYFQSDFSSMVVIPNLERVWIKYLALVLIVHEEFPFEKCLTNCDMDKLKSVTIWYAFGSTSPENWKNNTSYTKYYGTQKRNQRIESNIVCYEKFDRDCAFENWESDSDVFMALRPKNTRKLYLGQESLITIKPKQLVLRTLNNVEKCREMIKNYGQYLESLSIIDESLPDQPSGIEALSSEFVHLKQIRHFAMHLPYNTKINIEFISTFTKLTSLHFFIPASCEPRILLNIFKNCKSLVTLSIELCFPNETFLDVFSQALLYLTNLKEFIFRPHDGFEFDSLIASLNLHGMVKLEKLWIITAHNASNEFNVEVWNKYLERNEQLRDCLVSCASLERWKKKVERLARIYQRPYRKLYFDDDFSMEGHFERQRWEFISHNINIDKDFFIVNS